MGASERGRTARPLTCSLAGNPRALRARPSWRAEPPSSSVARRVPLPGGGEEAGGAAARGPRGGAASPHWSCLHATFWGPRSLGERRRRRRRLCQLCWPREPGSGAGTCPDSREPGRPPQHRGCRGLGEGRKAFSGVAPPAFRQCFHYLRSPVNGRDVSVSKIDLFWPVCQLYLETWGGCKLTSLSLKIIVFSDSFQREFSSFPQ